MKGRRPIATSTTSASSVCASPPSLGSTRTLAPVLVLPTPSTLKPRRESYALLFQHTLELLGHLLVHARQDAIEEFDDFHFGAEPLPDRAELEPDDAAADDDELFRHGGELERALGRDDDPLVDFDARQPRDIRAGRDADRFRVHRPRRAVGRLHLDLAGRRDAATADEGIDLVLLEEESDAGNVGADGIVLVLHHCLEIELRLADAYAKRREVMRDLFVAL